MTLEDLSLQIIFLIVGIIASIIITKMYRDYKEIEYYKENVGLIPETTVVSSNLVLLNDGNPIRNVSLLRVIIWNSGNKTLTDSDIRSENRLKITSVGNIEILSCVVDEITKLDNNMNVNLIKRKKEYSLNFAYLSPKDGCVISIIHTGSSVSDIEFSGIVESSGPVKLRGNESIWKKVVRESIAGIGLGITTMGIFLVSLPSIIEFSFKNILNTMNGQVVILVLIFLLFIVVVMFSLAFIYRRSYDYFTQPPKFFKKIQR